MIPRKESQGLIDRVLGLTQADDCVVRLQGARREHLRFANNQVTTSGIDEDQTVSVTVAFGSRSATASTNRLDLDGLTTVIRQAEELARLMPEDPEYMPPVGRQTYSVGLNHRQSERKDAAQAGCAQIVGAATNAGLQAAGVFEQHTRSDAVGTSNRCFAWAHSTHATVSATARTADGTGSGWANDVALRAEDLDFRRVALTATEKAQRSTGARPLEPGRYLTIFEPSAVAELAELLSGSLDQRRTDEGRSFLSAPGGANRVGEKLFPEWLSAMSNPSDARAPHGPFTPEGLPHMPSFWIQQGAITRLPCSRYWAKQAGTGYQAPPSNWLMSGGEGTVDDLIAKTERGVLVTSLWYIRGVDPRRLLYTGLTRDGLFWIEDGKIAHPLTNMRWNDTPLDVFGKAIDAGTPVRAMSRKGSGDTVVPPLRTEGFHFTSVSNAV